MDLFQMFSRLNKKGKKKLWNKIKAECDTYPNELVKIPIDFVLPLGKKGPKEAWRSRGYAVQIYDVNESWERLTIHRTAFDCHFTRWLDGITWDRIQALKAECGRGDHEAIEFYPADRDLVNVANLRHIWVRKNKQSLIEELGIGWKQDDAKPVDKDLISLSLAMRASAQDAARPVVSELQPAVDSAAGRLNVFPGPMDSEENTVHANAI